MKTYEEIFEDNTEETLVNEMYDEYLAEQNISTKSKEKNSTNVVDSSTVRMVRPSPKSINPELEKIRADTLKWFKDFEEKVQQEIKEEKNKNKTRNSYSENTKKVEGSTVLGEIVADETVAPSKTDSDGYPDQKRTR